MKSNVQNRLQLRTPVKIPPSSIEITHKNLYFCVGSCFATHIFEKLHHHWFTTKLNPAGITYNPISLASQIQWLLNEMEPISELILIEDQWIPLIFMVPFVKKTETKPCKNVKKASMNFLVCF